MLGGLLGTKFLEAITKRSGLDAGIESLVDKGFTSSLTLVNKLTNWIGLTDYKVDKNKVVPEFVKMLELKVKTLAETYYEQDKAGWKGKPEDFNEKEAQEKARERAMNKVLGDDDEKQVEKTAGKEQAREQEQQANGLSFGGEDLGAPETKKPEAKKQADPVLETQDAKVVDTTGYVTTSTGNPNVIYTQTPKQSQPELSLS
jgi:hypothetical protein